LAESVLNLHSGGHLVTYEELKAVPTPKPEGRWHPVAHSAVLDTVVGTLTGAGYAIKNQALAIARDGKRFFGTLDLGTSLSDGVALAVGIRNSTDKSFPLAFAAGSRVFVCSNLAFTAELLVKRKHTRLAVGRWNNEIGGAVQKLPSFASAEESRIKRLKELELSDDQALAFILRAMEREVIAAPVIPKVLAEWRTPTHDYGTGDRPTAWRLLNSFTTALGKRAVSNPAEYVGQTIRLNAMLALPEGGHEQAA
jgi:hypothetical protein